MRRRRGTYTGYSIGCAVVWEVILTALGALPRKEKLLKILPAFDGWWVGWTSARSLGTSTRLRSPDHCGSEMRDGTMKDELLPADEAPRAPS